MLADKIIDDYARIKEQLIKKRKSYLIHKNKSFRSKLDLNNIKANSLSIQRNREIQKIGRRQAIRKINSLGKSKAAAPNPAPKKKLKLNLKQLLNSLANKLKKDTRISQESPRMQITKRKKNSMLSNVMRFSSGPISLRNPLKEPTKAQKNAAATRIQSYYRMVLVLRETKPRTRGKVELGEYRLHQQKPRNINHDKNSIINIVKNGNLKMLEVQNGGLRGPELDFLDNNGHSPLGIAIWQKDLRMVEKLLRLGADPRMKCYKGYKPGTLARIVGDKEITRLIDKASTT